MAVPPVPFLASQALAEFGIAVPNLVSALAGRGGGPGVPFLLSQFAGLANSVVIALSPQDQNEFGSGGAFLFPAVTAIPASGAPTAYNWGVDYSEGGAFAVVGGQGTASAAFQVTGVGISGNALANIYCDVTINGVVNRGIGSLTYARL